MFASPVDPDSRNPLFASFMPRYSSIFRAIAFLPSRVEVFLVRTHTRHHEYMSWLHILRLAEEHWVARCKGLKSIIWSKDKSWSILAIISIIAVLLIIDLVTLIGRLGLHDKVHWKGLLAHWHAGELHLLLLLLLRVRHVWRRCSGVVDHVAVVEVW